MILSIIFSNRVVTFILLIDDCGISPFHPLVWRVFALAHVIDSWALDLEGGGRHTAQRAVRVHARMNKYPRRTSSSTWYATCYSSIPEVRIIRVKPTLPRSMRTYIRRPRVLPLVSPPPYTKDSLVILLLGVIRCCSRFCCGPSGGNPMMVHKIAEQDSFGWPCRWLILFLHHY